MKKLFSSVILLAASTTGMAADEKSLLTEKASPLEIHNATSAQAVEKPCTPILTDQPLLVAPTPQEQNCRFELLDVQGKRVGVIATLPKSCPTSYQLTRFGSDRLLLHWQQDSRATFEVDLKQCKAVELPEVPTQGLADWVSYTTDGEISLLVKPKETTYNIADPVDFEEFNGKSYAYASGVDRENSFGLLQIFVLRSNEWILDETKIVQHFTDFRLKLQPPVIEASTSKNVLDFSENRPIQGGEGPPPGCTPVTSTRDEQFKTGFPYPYENSTELLCRRKRKDFKGWYEMVNTEDGVPMVVGLEFQAPSRKQIRYFLEKRDPSKGLDWEIFLASFHKPYVLVGTSGISNQLVHLETGLVLWQGKYPAIWWPPHV